MIISMLNPLQIIPILAFRDNYIWLIHNNITAIVVDPGDADVVLEVLTHLNLKPEAILITHHHHDHIDGVATLVASYPTVTVYAPKLESYTFNHIPVAEPDTIEFEAINIKFSVIDLPGHTLGHLAYYANLNDDQTLLFCGDTLFGAGCGRQFEGTSAQMYASLQKLAVLPPDTRIYCAHEYTLQNINFALSLEPNNPALIERQQEVIRLRSMQQSSIPSTIQLELETNPFLRCHSDVIRTSIQLKNASFLQVFSTIRELRNHY